MIINSNKIEKFEQQYGIKLSSTTYYPRAWIFNKQFTNASKHYNGNHYPFTFKINDEYYTWCPNKPDSLKGEWIKDYPLLIEYMIEKMKITFM